MPQLDTTTTTVSPRQEETIPLMPIRVDEPIESTIDKDKRREMTEIEIQKQLDAIREVEKQFQVNLI